MVFRTFRFQVIVRVVLLILFISLMAWCLVNQLYFRSSYVAVAVLVLVIEFVWYVERSNRDLNNFMLGLLQRDFTMHYPENNKGRTYNELYQTLNQITSAFKTISAEKEVQHRYLETLVQHVRVGILSFDADEKIHLANQAVKDLLQKKVLSNLKSFELIDTTLVETMRKLRSGETSLVKVMASGQLLQLSIHASEFKLEGVYYKLISLQNIRTELDAREMEAWQQLIRVLTHEIMNSVSPITSLGSSLHQIVKQHSSMLNVSNSNLYDTLDKGLEAIKIRGEGLQSFTQAYRRLSGIPKPKFRVVNLKDILKRVMLLMDYDFQKHKVKSIVSELDIMVNVDVDLIEQVFINLLLNAVEAVKNVNDPLIIIRCETQNNNRVLISITDNGSGIEQAVIDKIFIPFFTTRKDGSGIGLALTKQILQLHHADIRVKSELGEGTIFFILL